MEGKDHNDQTSRHDKKDQQKEAEENKEEETGNKAIIDIFKALYAYCPLKQF